MCPVSQCGTEVPRNTRDGFQGVRSSNLRVPTINRHRQVAIPVSVPVSVSVPDVFPPPPSLRSGSRPLGPGVVDAGHPLRRTLPFPPASPAVVAGWGRDELRTLFCGVCRHRSPAWRPPRDNGSRARQRVVDGRLLRIRPFPRSLPAPSSGGPEVEHQYPGAWHIYKGPSPTIASPSN